MTSSPSILEQVLTSYGRREIVKIRDVENVEKILSVLVNQGRECLQVIADFDMTLSRYHIDGERCTSSIGTLSTSHLMSDEMKQAKMEMFKKYYAIEICPNTSIENKIPHMIDWYTQSHGMITSCGYTKSHIAELVAATTCDLRENARETLKALHEADVPVLIISAGQGDVLSEILRSRDALFPNKKIVSNFMEFGEDGTATNFKEPLIHTFNKCDVGTLEKDYFESIVQRNNVILLGDCIGDDEMDKGVINPNAVLKIGFLNCNIEERLPSFQDVFDIVILDDQSMDFVNIVLKQVLKN